MTNKFTLILKMFGAFLMFFKFETYLVDIWAV